MTREKCLSANEEFLRSLPCQHINIILPRNNIIRYVGILDFARRFGFRKKCWNEADDVVPHSS